MSDENHGGPGGVDGVAPWLLLAEPVELSVRCGGADHRLRWIGGTVVLVDHPNLEAELAMIALGGPEPACVARYRLWHDAVADGGFLAEWVDETRLTPAWFSWLTMALERMRSEGFHEFLRRLPPARAQRMGEFLNRFPLPWIDRAAATVDQRCSTGEQETVDQSMAALLAEATAQRVRRAFVDGVGGRQVAVGAAALVPLRIIVGGEPAVSGALTGSGRGVSLTVPTGWLHRVWIIGSAVTDGRLVLSLEADGAGTGDGDGDGEQAQAVVVTWDEDAAGIVPGLERRRLTLTNAEPAATNGSPNNTSTGQED